MTQMKGMGIDHKKNTCCLQVNNEKIIMTPDHKLRRSLFVKGNISLYVGFEYNEVGQIIYATQHYMYEGTISFIMKHNQATVRYDDAGGLIYYKDHDGNEWHKHWGVPFFYQARYDEFRWVWDDTMESVDKLIKKNIEAWANQHNS